MTLIRCTVLNLSVVFSRRKTVHYFHMFLTSIKWRRNDIVPSNSSPADLAFDELGGDRNSSMKRYIDSVRRNWN